MVCNDSDNIKSYFHCGRLKVDTKELDDLCLTCGEEVPSKVNGGMCCEEPYSNSVHQAPCNVCGRLIGFIVNDDYCSPEILFCPDCMNNKRKPGEDEPCSCHMNAPCRKCLSNGNFQQIP